MVAREEMAAAVLLPYFDAVRDVFSGYRPEPGVRLEKVARVRFVVDSEIRDKPRHFAATRDDGTQMYFAPEIVELSEDQLIAIVAHEFGHATDFLYPCRWISPADGPGKAVWVCDTDTKPAREWRRLWARRNRDQVEWSADGIAETVTGKRIVYSGDCILQCFGRGIERPAGLR